MGYKSKDKTVEKALNKTWVLIGIPLFTSMFGTFILGFYILDKYKLMGDLTPLIVILLGIVVPGIICHNISKIWFSVQIDKVDDKLEFYERALRLQMIWPPTAEKIIKKKGIILIERKSGKSEVLTDLIISDDLILTSENLIANGEFYLWKEIKDFRITSHGSSTIPQKELMIFFKDDTFVMKSIKSDSVHDLEYQIDKYLNSNNFQ